MPYPAVREQAESRKFSREWKMKAKSLAAIPVAILWVAAVSALAGESPVLKTKALTSAQIMRITGEAALNVGDVYGGDLYNGNRDVYITELSIYVKTQKNGEIFPRIYLCKIDIAPMATVPFGIDIASGDENADYSWGIIKARGYPVDPQLMTSFQSSK
jgi:hypothetical protein